MIKQCMKATEYDRTEQVKTVTNTILSFKQDVEECCNFTRESANTINHALMTKMTHKVLILEMK